MLGHMAHASKMKPKPILWPQQVFHPSAPQQSQTRMGMATLPSSITSCTLPAGPWSSRSILRCIQWDEARHANAVSFWKPVPALPLRHPAELLMQGGKHLCTVSHTPWPKPASNSFAKHLPWKEFKGTRPRQTLGLPKNKWGIKFPSPLHAPPGHWGQKSPSAGCSWLP